MDETPTSDWTWINAAADRFERAWKLSRHPRIEDYLAEVDEPQRVALLEELIRVEVELRRRAGEEPVGAEYAARFREHVALIEAVFGSDPGRPTPSVPAHEMPTIAPATTAGQTGGNVEPSPGSRVRYFGDYEITREIARGGMGVVFHAIQISLSRPVALKMILAGQLADDTDVKRFYTEAEAAAQLDHPGIVPIYEVGQHEGQHYFSMGFISGESLAQRLAEGPLPARDAASLLLKVADAIASAHRRGVIHRDLKPSNILIDADGNPRVTDFGLAKRVQGDSGLTGSGQIMGTPSYMPPEQAGSRRGEVGPAADVYALGATLYCMVTSRPPFQAATAMDTVLQVLTDEPVPPRRLNTAIPRDLETICLKCLEKEPGRRYATAAELKKDLERYLAGEPLVARPISGIARVIKWARRRPAIATLVGIVVVVSSLGLGGVLWQWRQAVLARSIAVQESSRAKAQTKLAELHLEASVRAQAKERQQTELAQQRLYDVQMNVVQRAWDDYHGALLQQGLGEQLPAYQEGFDRRGFEWYYWERKIASGHTTIEADPNIPTLAFSPDSRRIATIAERTVKVWDAMTGQLALTLNGHTEQVWSVAFSPEGKSLASAGFDRTVKLWDAVLGREIFTLSGHTDRVWRVAFSPDGRQLASTSADGTIKLWDAATRHDTVTLKGQTIAIFSPDGKRVASAEPVGTLKVWDAATGEISFMLKGHKGNVRSLAFSPDGRQIASAGNDGTARLWDLEIRKEIFTFNQPEGAVYVAAFSPDGKHFATAGSDGTTTLWDSATGKKFLTLKGQAAARGVAFSPDGRRIATAGWDEIARIWNAATGEQTLELKGHRADIGCVSFSSDGLQLASASADGTVMVWDPQNGQETLTLHGHTSSVWSVAFSPDGTQIASAGADETVKLWEVATGNNTRSINAKSDVRSVMFSPDGKRIVSAMANSPVTVWDAATGQETLTVGGHVSATFSPDGKRIAAADPSGNTMTTWDTATGKELLSFEGHTAMIYGVAFSPDGKRIASAGDDMSVKLWDAGTGQLSLTLRGHAREIWGTAFSPDGLWIASASENMTVTVWNSWTGKELHALKGHTGAVTSVAFDPTGNRLASGSDDMTVKVWDVKTWQEVLTLRGHSQSVQSVAFSPDGHRLASASMDGTVRVWDARSLDDGPAKPGPTPR